MLLIRAWLKLIRQVFLDNTGHHFENLVYLDLKRQGHEVYYYLTETPKEIDFLSRDALGRWHIPKILQIA